MSADIVGRRRQRQEVVLPGDSAAPDPASPLVQITKGDDDRRRALALAVTNEVARGRLVESQTDFHAVLVRGRRPNHLFHLFASVLTLGFWKVVWLAVIVFWQREKGFSVR